jgi:hypothetical protein
MEAGVNMAATVEVRVGPWFQQLPEIMAAKPEFQQDLMRAVGERGVDFMKEEVPVGTRELQDSISYEMTSQPGINEFMVVISAKAPHAVFIQEGTKPHMIRPVHRKALAWDGMVRKKVWHPGTQANPFLDRTRGRLLYDAVDLTLRSIDIWLRL